MKSSAPRHYLVTGGAGYLGSALIPNLLARGDWVTVIDRLLFGVEGCQAHIDHPRFSLKAIDVCDSKVNQAVAHRIAQAGAPKIQTVLHLAAAVGHQVCRVLGEDETHRFNVTGAERMFQLAQKLGARRFVFASTCSVYGRTQSQVFDESGDLQPVSLYGHSKVEAEEALQKLAPGSSCELLIFRLASVFGLSPRMRFDVLINQLVRQAHQDGKVVLFHPNHWRPFVHIQDVVDALRLALDMEALDREPLVVNLGSNKNCVTKQQLVEELVQCIPDLAIEVSSQPLSPPDQDVRLDFSRLETQLSFQAAGTLRQGMREVLSALRQGWFVFQPGRYQNRLSRL